jgi:hypothetical protein
MITARGRTRGTWRSLNLGRSEGLIARRRGPPARRSRHGRRGRPRGGRPRGAVTLTALSAAGRKPACHHGYVGRRHGAIVAYKANLGGCRRGPGASTSSAGDDDLPASGRDQGAPARRWRGRSGWGSARPGWRRDLPSECDLRPRHLTVLGATACWWGGRGAEVSTVAVSRRRSDI